MIRRHVLTAALLAAFTAHADVLAYQVTPALADGGTLVTSTDGGRNAVAPLVDREAWTLVLQCSGAQSTRYRLSADAGLASSSDPLLAYGRTYNIPVNQVVGGDRDTFLALRTDDAGIPRCDARYTPLIWGQDAGSTVEVSVTAPVTNSGTSSAPVIGCQTASDTQGGCLTAGAQAIGGDKTHYGYLRANAGLGVNDIYGGDYGPWIYSPTTAAEAAAVPFGGTSYGVAVINAEGIPSDRFHLFSLWSPFSIAEGFTELSWLDGLGTYYASDFCLSDGGACLTAGGGGGAGTLGGTPGDAGQVAFWLEDGGITGASGITVVGDGTDLKVNGDSVCTRDGGCNGVTSVSVTAPITNSGTASVPNIGCTSAAAGTAGCVTASAQVLGSGQKTIDYLAVTGDAGVGGDLDVARHIDAGSGDFATSLRVNGSEACTAANGFCSGTPSTVAVVSPNLINDGTSTAATLRLAPNVSVVLLDAGSIVTPGDLTVDGGALVRSLGVTDTASATTLRASGNAFVGDTVDAGRVVVTSAAATNAVTITTNGAREQFGNGALTYLTADGGTISTPGLFAVGGFDAGSVTLYADPSTGRVGFGTASPAVRANIVENANNVAPLRIQNTATTGYAGFEATDTSGTVVAGFGIGNSSTAAWAGTTYISSAGGRPICAGLSNNCNFKITTNGYGQFSARLGVEGADPAYSFDMGSGTGNTKLALYNGGGNVYGLGIASNEFRFHVDSSASRFSFFDAQAGNRVFNINTGTRTAEVSNLDAGTESLNAAAATTALTLVNNGAREQIGNGALTWWAADGGATFTAGAFAVGGTDAGFPSLYVDPVDSGVVIWGQARFPDAGDSSKFALTINTQDGGYGNGIRFAGAGGYAFLFANGTHDWAMGVQPETNQSLRWALYQIGSNSPTQVAGLSYSNGRYFTSYGYSLGPDGQDLLLDSVAVPSISSGGGTSPSISNANGTATFTVNVGTGGTASSIVVAMNATASTGWNCAVVGGLMAAGEITQQSNRSTTAVTFTNYTAATKTTAAWASGASFDAICRGR